MEHSHHTINTMSHTDKLDAELSKDAYSLSGHSGHDGDTSSQRFADVLHQSFLHHPDLTELKDMKILYSSSDCAILKNSVTNTCYLDIRGSDFSLDHHTLFRDLFNDGQIAIGDQPHRVQTIYHKYIEFKHLYPDCKWEATGHSLGGRIAEEIGRIDPSLNTVSFESGSSIFEHYDHDHDYDNITSHKITSDPVSFGDSPNEVIYHFNPDNGYNPHSIYNYTDDYSQPSW
jgi:hypothetical protein